jgi:drug/metabolite transporter (DMT)-like permease
VYSPFVSNRRGLVVALALLGVYRVWGTTFLATRFAIETLPPVLMIAIRCLSAGISLYTMVRFTGSARPSRRDWKISAILDISGMGICNSIVALVADRVPTEFMACTFATGSFILSITSWISRNGNRPGRREAPSMIAGFACVALLAGLGSPSA